MSIYLLLEGHISFQNLSVVWAVTLITQATAIAWSDPTTPPSPHGKGDFFWLQYLFTPHFLGAIINITA